ncbi:MAG TPA: L-histidine N(alpha)-methyltransferase [Nitrospirae bacterium]|nr:L-histidine N(alpha)-methyltransferase [Nitrospirota bacterium]
MDIQNHLDSSYHNEIRKDVLRGLTASRKSIPSKYSYDARGSRLFDEICGLPEYYQTRTEMHILKNAAPDIVGSFKNGDLVELGSGANWKVRMLLDAAGESSLSGLRYIPIDVSETALIDASEELSDIYPELQVRAVIADFTKHLYMLDQDRPKLIVFFGSTIGNFNAEESVEFLRNIADFMKPGDRFLIGVDMLKPRDILEAAYNDSRGVTSKFNKNILTVLNRELNADFDLSHFDHLAFFNEEEEHIEMHLKAKQRVSVDIKALGLNVELKEDETIHTEVCRKFSRESAGQMFSASGLAVRRWFSDPKEWFNLAELILAD